MFYYFKRKNTSKVKSDADFNIVQSSDKVTGVKDRHWSDRISSIHLTDVMTA